MAIRWVELSEQTVLHDAHQAGDRTLPHPAVHPAAQEALPTVRVRPHAAPQPVAQQIIAQPIAQPIPQPIPQVVPPRAVAQPRRPSQRRSRNRSMAPLLVVGGLGASTLIAIAAGVVILLASVAASGKALPNVVVADAWGTSLNVGGLSLDEMIAQLAQVTLARPIIMRDQDRTWTYTAAELGIMIDKEATATRAAQAGRDNLIDGLLHGATISPVYTLDINKALAAFTTLGDAANVTPRGLTKGRSLNMAATLDTFPPDLVALMQTGSVELVMDVVEGPHTTHTVQRGEELSLIAKKYNVETADIVALNSLQSADSIYPGQELIIPSAGVWQPTDKDAPPAPLAQGKAIVVSLGQQRIYAYENGHVVHSALVSTGRPGMETVLGDYKIYVKYVSTRMTGPGYDTPNVPYTMYFYQGYGIHGAYWHNSFGRVMSHGCVNLDTTEAKWFFDFASVGTPVRVIAN